MMTTSEKRRYLVVYDYGQRGVWTFVRARSPPEIEDTFGDLWRRSQERSTTMPPSTGAAMVSLLISTIVLHGLAQREPSDHAKHTNFRTDPIVARQDFQATWVPRIGQEATDALRSYRRASILPLAGCVLAGAAGLAFGGSTLDDLVGVALTALTLGLFGTFVRSKRRLAETLSLWFGMRIRSGQLPVMNSQRFDAWCEKRGLRRPGEPNVGPVSERAPDAAP
jgi:hypothetical protein